MFVELNTYSGINLDRKVLRDINLRGAYFDEVYMIGVDLTGSDLGGIFLKSCDLSRAIIRNADLRASCLDRSAFNNADLRGSNLNHMNASCANFRKVQIEPFEYAVLAGTYFKGAHTDDGMICRGQNLIWRTTMPSGIVVEGRQWGNGRDGRSDDSYLYFLTLRFFSNRSS